MSEQFVSIPVSEFEALVPASVVADVCRAYETKVSMALGHWLPPHTEKCDEGFTQRECLRCDVLANVAVAFGFARPLNVSRAANSHPGSDA